MDHTTWQMLKRHSEVDLLRYAYIYYRACSKKKVGTASHFSFETQKYMLSYEDGVGGGGRN